MIPKTELDELTKLINEPTTPEKAKAFVRQVVVIFTVLPMAVLAVIATLFIAVATVVAFTIFLLVELLKFLIRSTGLTRWKSRPPSQP